MLLLFNLSHIWFSFFPAAFCFSQYYCLFQRILPSYDVSNVGQLWFCHFGLQQCFRLNLLLDLLVLHSGSSGYSESYLPTPHLKWIDFLPIILLHCTNFCIHTKTFIIGNTRVWMSLALVSNETFLFLVILPNSSITDCPSECQPSLDFVQPSPFVLMTEPR